MNQSVHVQSGPELVDTESNALMSSGSAVNSPIPGDLGALPVEAGLALTPSASQCNPYTGVWHDQAPTSDQQSAQPNHNTTTQTVQESINVDQQSTQSHQPATSDSQIFTSSKPASIQQPNPKAKARLSLIEWRWELFTWALGTATVLTMLLLLIMFKDQPVGRWNDKVQISATIAVISQLAQSSLTVSVAACIWQLKWHLLLHRRRTIEIELLDEASRGPEGSSMILRNIFRRPERLLQIDE
jgi:hypothetical protein